MRGAGTGEVLVVKCGGATDVDGSPVCDDVASLVHAGRSVVLVHGGSAATEALGAQLGVPPRFLTSASGVRSRYTDPATLDVLILALAGRVRPALVRRLVCRGVEAVGLSGLDGGLIQARRKPAIKATVDGRLRVIRDDLTGTITGINVRLLRLLLEAGCVPVVSPPAHDPSAGPVNVDADRVAAAVARALEAGELVMLSNVPGLLRDPSDPGSVITEVPPGGFEECMSIAVGRMKLKVIAAGEALRGGVGRVVIGDARSPSPVFRALAGAGTVLRPTAIPTTVAR